MNPAVLRSDRNLCTLSRRYVQRGDGTIPRVFLQRLDFVVFPVPRLENSMVSHQQRVRIREGPVYTGSTVREQDFESTGLIRVDVLRSMSSDADKLYEIGDCHGINCWNVCIFLTIALCPRRTRSVLARKQQSLSRCSISSKSAHEYSTIR